MAREDDKVMNWIIEALLIAVIAAPLGLLWHLFF